MDKMRSEKPEDGNLQENINVIQAEKQKANADRQWNLLAYLHDFTGWISAILLIFFLLFRVVIVSGPSMKYTLLDGDYLLVLGNILYGKPEQGDIVVVSKDSFQDGEPIIKRVIATEGQEVDIDFVSGIVYVDGVQLEESYTSSLTTMSEGVTFPITVDDGCIFVMGDNRGDSLDSRSPKIGQIDCREVLGKAIFLFIPGNDKGSSQREFSRIGVLS